MVSVPPKESNEQLELGLEYSNLRQELVKILRKKKLPKPIVEKAYKITIRRLETGIKEVLNQPIAYFKEVLFRLLFENNQNDDDIKESRKYMKERILLSAFIHDLLEAGYSSKEIHIRLINEYGDRVSAKVLDEFETKLLSPKLRMAKS